MKYFLKQLLMVENLFSPSFLFLSTKSDFIHNDHAESMKLSHKQE